MCLRGSVTALVDDGTTGASCVLDRPDQGLYVPAMVWGTQYHYSDDAVLLVSPRSPYEAADYIRDYETLPEGDQRDVSRSAVGGTGSGCRGSGAGSSGVRRGPADLRVADPHAGAPRRSCRRSRPRRIPGPPSRAASPTPGRSPTRPRAPTRGPRWPGAPGATATLPLWDPHSFGGGVPWATDGVAATLYPVRALLDALFLPWLAHDLFVLVHLALAGAGAYWLARRWGAGRAGAHGRRGRVDDQRLRVELGAAGDGDTVLRRAALWRSPPTDRAVRVPAGGASASPRWSSGSAWSPATSPIPSSSRRPAGLYVLASLVRRASSDPAAATTTWRSAGAGAGRPGPRPGLGRLGVGAHPGQPAASAGSRSPSRR